MVRAPFYDKNGLKKGAWSREEDERLRAFVQKYGHSNWRQLPKFAGLARCGKSCRLRWLNYLRPDLKHGNYTQKEEELIIKLHHQLGNRWSLIAEKLPGRTDNQIKNYWHSHLKKFLKSNNEITTSSCDEVKSKPEDSPPQVKTITKNDQFAESERPSTSDYAPNFHQGSFPMSTETSSYTEEHSNSPTSSSVAQSTMNCRELNHEDSVVPSSVTFGEFSGNFWTEPFIVEGAYIVDEISSGDGLSFLIPYFYEGTDLF